MIATKRRDPVPMLVWQALLGAVLLLTWQAGVSAGWLDKFFFSRPSDVIFRVWQMLATGAIWGHLATTLLEAALSFLIGVAAGELFGFVLARNRFLSGLLDPYIRVANSLPRVVLAPI